MLDSPAKRRGWKIPETTLVYPWILRMFPDIHYILWVRDPRDSILNAHLTDDLADFGVPYERPAGDDVHMRRAISWKYQRDIVRATPAPKRKIEVRFEDFVLKNEEASRRLEEFLGFPMGRVITRPDAVYRWKTSGIDFARFEGLFDQEITDLGYDR